MGFVTFTGSPRGIKKDEVSLSFDPKINPAVLVYVAYEKRLHITLQNVYEGNKPRRETYEDVAPEEYKKLAADIDAALRGSWQGKVTEPLTQGEAVELGFYL